MMSASASGPTLPERWCHAIALDSSSAAPPSEEAEFKDEVLALESIFDNALAAVDPPSAPRSSASGLSVDTSLPVPPHLLCARSIAERTGKRAFCLSVAPFAEGEGCDDDDDDKSQVTFLAPQFESGAGVPCLHRTQLHSPRSLSRSHPALAIHRRPRLACASRRRGCLAARRGCLSASSEIVSGAASAGRAFAFSRAQTSCARVRLASSCLRRSFRLHCRQTRLHGTCRSQSELAFTGRRRSRSLSARASSGACCSKRIKHAI